MYYTISDMAKLLGVTTHTLRYYEKENLIRPFTDPNNGYRYYAVADTRRFNLCRELRAAGFSLEQCFRFVTEQNIDNLLPMIEARKAELDQQIYLMQNTHKFLDRLMNEYTHFSERENKFYTLTLPERWYLPISRNEKVISDKELLSEHAQWIQCMPVTYWISRIFVTNLTEYGRTDRPQYESGLMVEAEVAEGLGLRKTDNVMVISGGTYLGTLWRKEYRGDFRWESISYFMKELNQRGIAKYEDIFSSIVRSSVLEDGTVINHHYAGMRISEE